MKKIIFIIFLLMMNSVFAVKISQVLFDPKDESRGEAVELWNPSNEIVNISGWYLETERSSKDATIPKNTFMNPNSKFLITDPGWNTSKDNVKWRNSDYEESITLKNTNSFVKLRNNLGELIDEFYWEEQLPVYFYDKNTVPLELIVEKKDFYILDENEKEGVQIKGSTKKLPIKIYSSVQPKVEFLNETFFMNAEKNGYYNLTIDLSNISAGNYSLKINDKIINFEYLRFEDYEILTKKLIIKNKGVIKLKNKGNTRLELELTVDLPVKVKLKNSRIFLGVGEEKEFILDFDVKGVKPGTYNGILIIEKV